MSSVRSSGVPVAAASVPSSGPEHDPACLFPVPAGKGWVPASFPVCVTPHRSPAACPSQDGGRGQQRFPGVPPWLAGHCNPAPLPPAPTASPDLPQEEDGEVSGLGRLAPAEVRAAPEPLASLPKPSALGVLARGSNRQIPTVACRILSPPAGFCCSSGSGRRWAPGAPSNRLCCPACTLAPGRW